MDDTTNGSNATPDRTEQIRDIGKQFNDLAARAGEVVGDPSESFKRAGIDVDNPALRCVMELVSPIIGKLLREGFEPSEIDMIATTILEVDEGSWDRAAAYAEGLFDPDEDLRLIRALIPILGSALESLRPPATAGLSPIQLIYIMQTVTAMLHGVIAPLLVCPDCTAAGNVPETRVPPAEPEELALVYLREAGALLGERHLTGLFTPPDQNPYIEATNARFPNRRARVYWYAGATDGSRPWGFAIDLYDGDTATNHDGDVVLGPDRTAEDQSPHGVFAEVASRVDGWLSPVLKSV